MVKFKDDVISVEEKSEIAVVLFAVMAVLLAVFVVTPSTNDDVFVAPKSVELV